ncbi:MAG: DNA-processing protein DprA [Candidatus Eremiobacteraeota bacterium]|nr:DNA-processing protein DprA [Candidatus Eremiobacteraeota bacterium]
MDELELGYLLAVSGAAVWTPRPLVAMLSTLGGARAIVSYARAAPAIPPPDCELLGAEALDRIAAINDDHARVALDDARALDHQFITSSASGYPRRLHDLCDPPPVMYYRGCLAALDGNVVALVGSRAATPYGRSMAGSTAADFVLYGASIISGLARGIDAAAHRGALRGQTPTIAVIGSGLRALYPSYHSQLAAEIVAAGGAIISEFPPTMTARPHQFPMRNRLVAALADATFVIEAGAKSGALITARLACELGRHVFALPGDVGRSTSEGTNGLIKDGVALATSASDIAAVLGWHPIVNANAVNRQHDAVLETLAPGGSTIDEVCAKTGLDSATIAAQLTMLEMAGVVERHAGGLYGAVRAVTTAKAETR